MKLDVRDLFINFERMSFEMKSHCSNVDVISENDSMRTIYDGTIRDTRMNGTINIGEFSISVIHTEMANLLNIETIDTFNIFSSNEFYDDLNMIVKKKLVDFNSCEKLIIVSDMVVIKEYRKKDVLMEFMKFLYKNFHSAVNVIILHALPFQYNDLTYELYYNFSVLDLKDTDPTSTIYDYFGLDEFEKEDDYELNTYKLYGHMVKHGCEKIGSTNFFKFNPEHIKKNLI